MDFASFALSQDAAAVLGATQEPLTQERNTLTREPPVTGSATCITCGLQFANYDEQRDHYRSLWHTHNLKRSMAGLPPITEEVYEHRKALVEAEDRSIQQQQSRKQRRRDRKTRETLSCELCGKSFSSDGALQQHVKSQKHRASARARGLPEHAIKLYRKSEAVSTAEETLKSVLEDASKRTRRVHGAEQEHWDNLEAALAALAPETSQEDRDAAYFELMWEHVVQHRRELDIFECPFCDHYHVEDRGDAAQFVEFLDHLATEHSFFIPEPEFCCDVPGVLALIQEKVGMWYVCPTCNRQFDSLAAVRDHCASLAHCRMKHEENDEYAEFYDYSSMWPAAEVVGASDEEEESDEEEDEEDFKKYVKYVPEREYTKSGALVLQNRVIGTRAMQRYQNRGGLTRELTEGEQKKLHIQLAQKATSVLEAVASRKPLEVAEIRIRRREISRRSRYDLKLGQKMSNLTRPSFKDQNINMV